MENPPLKNAEDENAREARFAEKLAPFAEEFRALVRDYRVAPSPAGLDRILDGLLTHQLGEKFLTVHVVKQDAARLIEDFGLDSLALVELSFLTEDFLAFAIQPEDFARIATLRDLRGFLHAKLFPTATT